MFSHNFVYCFICTSGATALCLRSETNAWCRSNDMTEHDRLVLSIYLSKPLVSAWRNVANYECSITPMVMRETCIFDRSSELCITRAHIATVASYIRILQTNDRCRGRVHLHRLNSFYFYFLHCFCFFHFIDKYLVQAPYNTNRAIVLRLRRLLLLLLHEQFSLIVSVYY